MSRYANIFLKIRNADHVADILGVDPSYLRFIVLSPRYRHFRIPKASGGTRLIEAPDRVHKFLQRKLNRYLQNVYHTVRPIYVHGFIKRLKKNSDRINIRSNAEFHTGKKYVINADLQDFFHSITASRVRDVFTTV